MSAYFQVFHDDDAGYLAWIRENPSGWILNVPRAPSGTIVEHRSTCGSICNEKTSNWTGPHYYKVVAVSEEALREWISANWVGRTRLCGRCIEADGKRVLRSPAIRPGVSEAAPIRSTAILQVSQVEEPWTLWSLGRPLKVLEDCDPRIASWDRKVHVNQVRLKAYLMAVKAHFASVLADSRSLAVGLTVDLRREDRLYRGNDVENYITPLVNALGWRNFVYAQVEKRVGGGSRIEIGPAVQSATPPAGHAWSGGIRGNLATAEGKRSIRLDLLKAIEAPLPPGPMAVHMAWRLPSARNWVGLWKPTGDAMGPVVGESRFPKNEFHPDDDRITKLMLHRCADDTRDRRMVDVGLWWSAIGAPTSRS